MTAPPPKPRRGESHAQQRARERFGIDLTPADFLQIRKDISAGNAIYLRDDAVDPDAAHFEVLVRGRLVRIVYHLARGRVITALIPGGPDPLRAPPREERGYRKRTPPKRERTA